jgi:hypothetical protein
MNEERKYVTFRDLRSVAKPEPAQESTEKTSISSNTSSTSISSNPSPPSITSSSSTTSTTHEAEKPRKPSIAPERDFQRVPNSVTRRAIPEGLFRGKSKQVWDYLWSITRGAIVPARTVRKSRREIKAGAGLGSMVTVDAALQHLESVGLIKIKPAIGSLIGNEYEIFTPEEANTSISSIASTASPTQKVEELVVPETSTASTTQVIDNNASYGQPKTSFKTNNTNDDDEAFANFIESWRKAAKEITGRESSRAEAAKWQELADVLITELRIAAARTTVSSVPAFLSEHLRRRLWKKDKQQLSEESRADTNKTKSQGQNIDISKCLNCGGSGMYYPEGYEKGVAKCKHERLGQENNQAN